MSGEFVRSETFGQGAAPPPSNGSLPGSPQATKPQPAGFGGGPVGGNGNAPPVSNTLNKAVEDVMYSDIGVQTLLNRLKQSVASARDFAAFLKKRSSLEEEQAKGLKRLAQSQQEKIQGAEVRAGTYAVQLTQVLQVHERMADNGMQFALSLHQMHEDLDVLSANMERGRKQWKHEGLDAEAKSSNAEQAMQKAKTKYDNLAEEYDRAKTGDIKSTKKISIRGPKSTEQYESDLQRKVEAADSDYKDKVRTAQQERQTLINLNRPKAVKALQELVNECDSAVTLQLQKFATFNEKLLLGNGLAVSPLDSENGSRSHRSLRDLVAEINNDTDLRTHLAGFTGKIPPRSSEIRYEPHPTLAPKTQTPTKPTPVAAQPSAPTMQPTLAVHTQPSQPASMNSRYAAPTQAQSPPSAYNQPSGGVFPGAVGQSAMGDVQAPPYQSSPPPFNLQHSQPQARDGHQQPPYPSHSPDHGGSLGQINSPTSPSNQHQQSTGSIPMNPAHQHQQGTGSIPMGAPAPQIAPQHNFSPHNGSKGRVFGVSLDALFARDQSAVPTIVIQCIQAIDMFGLETEGIYRHNGTLSHVNRLKDAFDNLPPNAPGLDFRNPSNFYHDVNAVGSLLKQFFRELPDPLFTRAGYGNFIEAAQVDDEGARRDGLHQAINDLPDPNYATLRALVLHLARVMQNESKTRMTAENLAVCLAPTLMGNQTGGAIADASWQSRAVATILANANAIFDDD